MNVPKKKADPVAARRQILAQWRGFDSDEAEKSKRPAQSAAAIVRGVLQNLKLDQRRSESEILNVWNHLIDPNIVAHAQPTGLHHRTLFVTVDSSAWLDEIVRYRRAEILARLQHSFGRQAIAKISFRLG